MCETDVAYAIDLVWGFLLWRSFQVLLKFEARHAKLHFQWEMNYVPTFFESTEEPQKTNSVCSIFDRSKSSPTRKEQLAVMNERCTKTYFQLSIYTCARGDWPRKSYQTAYKLFEKCTQYLRWWCRIFLLRCYCNPDNWMRFLVRKVTQLVRGV